MRTLTQAVRGGDLESWSPHALALFFGWGALLVAGSCLLPGRDAPGFALAAAAVALVAAIALVRFAAHCTERRLSGVLGLGSVLIALVVYSSGQTASPDSMLFVWVSLYGGFFLGSLALAGHIGLVTVLYAAVLVIMPGGDRDASAAPQHLLLVAGAVAAAGVWSAVLRELAESLVGRHLRLARTDTLSGLANRGELLRRGEALLAEHQGFAILLIDLDAFKLVNDRLGHAAGDDLLCHAAERLTAVARATDLVARLGGDEFALLATGTDLTEGGAIAGRVTDTIGRPFSLGQEVVSVGVSVGVAVAGPTHGEFDAVMRDADLAMYAAKRDGGGWRGFDPAMRKALTERRNLVRDLEAALDGQLSLRYQPIADVASGRTEIVEALVRWEHPTQGTVGPDRFIPLAESTGLIVELGRWVLAEACSQAGGWRTLTGATPVVSVNLSPRQLLDPQLVDDVVRSLGESGLPAQRLMLEITETTVMTDPELAVARLHELRALGVRLAVDDFGTGHSSLAYLQRLPVTDLKLARDFVSNLDTSAADLALARGIIALAHALGLRVIAEGVELPTQLAHLRGMGCDLVQGYLLDRPLHAADLLTRLGTPVAGAVAAA